MVSSSRRPSMFLATAFALFVGLFTSFSTLAADAIGKGEFTGLNGHATLGQVMLVQTANGVEVQLGENFSFDGAPDPKVALGKDGKYDKTTLMGLLSSNSGASSYQVPAGIDVSQYNEVYIWCEKYSVGLGVAALK